MSELIQKQIMLVSRTYGWLALSVFVPIAQSRCKNVQGTHTQKTVRLL